ncbi:MAG: hypothetical protein K5876_02380 [Ruminiclostridium sp.]|nr:hypothetical protein [Ruminiclostridium sp.]
MKISDNAVKLAAATLALLTACSCSDISGAQTPAPAKETGKVVIVEPDEAGPGAVDYDVIPDDGVTSTAKRKAPEDTEAAETVTSTAVPEITTTTTTTTTTTPEITTTTKAPETTTTTTAAPETTTTTAAPETAVTAVQETKAATAAAAQSADYNVIGENGILVSYQNGHYRGIMACYGTYDMCDRWTNALNKFAAKLPDTNVYSLVIPIASEFYTPQKFWDQGFTTKQLNKIEHIAENLSGVTAVDVYSALAAHTDEDIYARTDHHWNPLGAYYAANAFADAAGVDFPELGSYTPVSLGGYVGSMYTYSKDVHLYNDPEVFTMYLSPNADRIKTTYRNSYFGGAYAGDLFVSRKAASYYCSFLGSDDRIAEIETDVKNGRTLVVFKMSYGNALIPFLTSGFEKIYVCDMRYFELNGVQFCKDVGATDLLFTDCVMMVAGNAGKYLEYILNR